MPRSKKDSSEASSSSSSKRVKIKKEPKPKSKRKSKSKPKPTSSAAKSSLYPYVKSIHVITHEGQPFWWDTDVDVVVGIDIGEVNYGIVVMDVKTGRVLQYIMVNLRKYMSDNNTKKINMKDTLFSLDKLMFEHSQLKHVFCSGKRSTYCTECKAGGPSLILIEEQMPGNVGNQYGNNKYVKPSYTNLITLAVSAAFGGVDRCRFVPAESAKRKLAEKFPKLLTDSRTASHDFNKVMATKLVPDVLNKEEQVGINHFLKIRWHHLMDAWLCAYYAISELNIFQKKKQKELEYRLY